MKKFLFSLLFISNFSFAQNPLVKQWDYRYGGLDQDWFYDFQQTNDGGYILGGESSSPVSGDKTQPSWGDNDYWIVKTNSLGIYQWDKRFGGDNDDELYALQQTSDGGYILGGWSRSGITGDKSESSRGVIDYWVVKIDSLGIKQWDKRFGGNNIDALFSLEQTADGGYILGGDSYSGISGDKTQPNWDTYLYYPDYWIVKIDSSGGYQWDKRFGGTGDDELHSIRQTKDGGYIMGGMSNSGIGGDKTQANWDITLYHGDYWIVKIDSDGNYQWDKRFGGTEDDGVYSLQQTTDAGYILAGSSNSGINGDKTQPTWGDEDYWIVKIDSVGNQQWDKDFGGTDIEELSNLQKTDDGYLISGSSYSSISGDKTEDNLGVEQTWIIKTDSLGNKEWDKTIFTTGHDEVGMGIQTSDGCYAIALTTDANLGGYKTQPNWGVHDYWIIKFCDTTGAYLMRPTSYFNSNNQALCEKFCLDFYDQSGNNPNSWLWQFPGGAPSFSTDQNPTNICYNAAGAYDVTLITSNVNGSDTLTLTNYVTVYATPPFPTITQAGNTLMSSSSSSYQWQFNSNDIPGATNQSYTILQTGLYTVIVGDSNGCVNSATTYVLISGIDEVNSDVNLSIYPNPSSGNFIVEWLNGPDLVGMVGEISIDVMNMLGQKVFSAEESRSIGTAADLKKEIDLDDIARGVYFIEIKTEKEFMRKKILIAD